MKMHTDMSKYTRIIDQWFSGKRSFAAHLVSNLTNAEVLEFSAVFITHPKVKVDDLFILSTLTESATAVKGTKNDRP
jgi:hypothetical protein